jgi:hypothetical protein
MSSRALALIAVASLAPAAAALGVPNPDHRLRNGIGAGGVRLGMSEGQVLQVLGRPDDRRAMRTELGAFVDLSWPGLTVRRWDGAGGRVVNIAVTDRGIRMANGIGVGSSLARVRSAFPKASCDTSPLVCTIGNPVPGNTVTTLRFSRTGRVSEVSVGRVID